MPEPKSSIALEAPQVEINCDANLLIIRYAGRVDVAEVEQCLAATEKALPAFAPGFCLLVDLTQLESMEPACAPSIRKIMQLCNASGVSLVARIIPDPARDIGLQIMSYFHYGPDVQTITCANPAEAEEILFA
jgi:anti-anti-sigma regulatory factor